jgi:hypothetical protein
VHLALASENFYTAAFKRLINPLGEIQKKIKISPMVTKNNFSLGIVFPR